MAEKILNNLERVDLDRQGSYEKLPDNFFDKLSALVKKVYQSRCQDAYIIKDNLEHTEQVLENVKKITSAIINGQEKSNITKNLAKDKTTKKILINKDLLQIMAILHDAAKIDESGKVDTFHHHEAGKVRRIIGNKSFAIKDLLQDNNITDAEIDLIIDGIERHSRKTDFIYRHYQKEHNQGQAKPLPSARGVLEYAILSDADILTHSKLEQGIKKIVCIRLNAKEFIKEDRVEGRHNFFRTLTSAAMSASKADQAMYFNITKKKVKENIKELAEFENWLKENNKISKIDQIKELKEKKKYFDKLIEEFLDLKNRTKVL